MALMFVFSAVIVIPVWLYMYYAAKRAVTLWVSKEKKLKVCIIALLVSSIIMIPSLDMWGKMATWSIAVVHLLVFTLITQLINYVIKKVSTNKYYKICDYIYRLMLIPIICVIVTFTYGFKAVDNMNAIVTSGLSGWGYPIRTQSVSEYVILNIQN